MRNLPLPRKVFLEDDGTIPNSRLPLLVYAGVLKGRQDRARAFEELFADNGWSRSWRNGMYAFRHYHSTTHEVLGIAVGSARVEFGGPHGTEMDIAAGDAVLIPAGVSHCNLAASGDLLVIGAYPDGSASVDLLRDSASARTEAVPRIDRVPLPPRDPILGTGGLLQEWV